jgi:leucyl/phenylalanyl-tRNA---protein transferase
MTAGPDRAVDPDGILSAALVGAFPMDDEPDGPIRYFTANPRAVVIPGERRVPRTVAREVRAGRFEFRSNTDFDGVIAACAAPRGGGVWLTPRLVDAYRQLHRSGVCHSFEIWTDGRLAAGLFGLCLGTFVSGESMFHRVSGAGSALIASATEAFEERGVTLFDIQMMSPHLARFGAREISHRDYVRRLEAALGADFRAGSLV